LPNTAFVISSPRYQPLCYLPKNGNLFKQWDGLGYEGLTVVKYTAELRNVMTARSFASKLLKNRSMKQVDLLSANLELPV